MIPDQDVSRRLKAARWLAGDVGEDGKPRALSVSELAERDELVRNRISANRLEEIEQTRTQARPVELYAIARALRMPEQWFEASYQLVGADATPAMVAQKLAQVAERLSAIEAGVTALCEADTPPAPSDELLRPPGGDATTGHRGRGEQRPPAAGSQ